MPLAMSEVTNCDDSKGRDAVRSKGPVGKVFELPLDLNVPVLVLRILVRFFVFGR